jgi:hypothetical protein
MTALAHTVAILMFASGSASGRRSRIPHMFKMLADMMGETKQK